ncbi:MAG: hypothetical protein KDD99_13470, partial [Bacteroidetes bacterium]|nr:hypothetical protein [Bacteroidota bacterium]
MGTTLRQVSTEYISEAEGLLLRAGYLRLVSTGNPAYLHLGQKTIKKIADSFLQKLQEMGGVSVQLPHVESPEFWQKLNLPTHLPYDSRAVLSHIASGEISSYRQLPGLFYQMNAYGKTPVLEFWGLNDGETTSQNQFDQISFAISEYLGSLGLKPGKAFGNPGFSLAKQSRDWVEEITSGRKMYLSDNDGLFSPTAYSPEKTAPESEPPKAVEKVHTPGTASIQDLADFLQIPASQTAKVVFYTAEVIGKKDPQLIIAVIRGDMDVSEDKVRNQIGALSLRAANEEEIKRVGCFPGFASPINIKRENVIVIADDLMP